MSLFAVIRSAALRIRIFLLKKSFRSRRKAELAMKRKQTKVR